MIFMIIAGCSGEQSDEMSQQTSAVMSQSPTCKKAISFANKIEDLIVIEKNKDNYEPLIAGLAQLLLPLQGHQTYGFYSQFSGNFGDYSSPVWIIETTIDESLAWRYSFIPDFIGLNLVSAEVIAQDSDSSELCFDWQAQPNSNWICAQPPLNDNDLSLGNYYGDLLPDTKPPTKMGVLGPEQSVRHTLSIDNRNLWYLSALNVRVDIPPGAIGDFDLRVGFSCDPEAYAERTVHTEIDCTNGELQDDGSCLADVDEESLVRQLKVTVDCKGTLTSPIVSEQGTFFIELSSTEAMQGCLPYRLQAHLDGL
ncbi:MAG: hypothetical protein IPJ88_03545 [Myxococcales bacterium]|nr:MAG: hypothetical protein IPJ88_03545 [Myxococcales bacterium]